MRLTEALCSGLCVCVGSPCASSSSPCCLGQGWSPTQGSLKLLSFQQPIPCWGSGLARLLEDRLGLFVGTWLEIPADSCCLQVVRKRHFSIWWFCWIAAPNFILFYFLKILFDVANLSKYKLLLAERKKPTLEIKWLFVFKEGGRLCCCEWFHFTSVPIFHDKEQAEKPFTANHFIFVSTSTLVEAEG